MRKFFAFLLIGCAMSLGCGEQPKVIPPEKTMPANPGNDPAASVNNTDTADPASEAPVAAEGAGEVVTAGEVASEAAPTPTPAPAPAPDAAPATK